jgi:hypothetical protein
VVTKEHVDAFAALDRVVYWKRGRYDLFFKFHTTRPAKVVESHWSFVLTDEDAESLHGNRIAIMRAVVGQPAQFNFAHPVYR